MEYKNFEKLITTLEEQDKAITELHNSKVDLFYFVDPYHSIIETLIIEIYGDQGFDWFNWFCYESEFGKKDWSKKSLIQGAGSVIKKLKKDKYGAHDGKGNKICYDIKSLYQYLEKNHLKK